MGYSDALGACLRELEAQRADAVRALEARKREVYEKIPRVMEIDERLSSTGINLSKKILSGITGPDAKKLIAGMERDNERLLREKNALLRENGYKINFLTDVYRCRLCADTGYIEAERCRCLKQKLIGRYYGLSNLSGALKKETFEHFSIDFYSADKDPQNEISPRANMQKILRVCRDFTADFGLKPSNLLFYGNSGLGKTFLCNCIAKELLDAGRTVLYTTAPQLFKTFENYRFYRDEMDEPDETVDMVFAADLLIIDDLGTEFTTGNSLSEFFNIVNSRILNEKPMVISTNLIPNDFEAIYTERIISRILGNFFMCKFFGQDIRVIKKYVKKR